MFCTFTTEQGALIIRTQDIRRMQDTPNGTRLVWVEEGARQEAIVLDSADENLARLKREELEAMAEAQRLQQRQGDGLPMLPIPRGRPR